MKTKTRVLELIVIAVLVFVVVASTIVACAEADSIAHPWVIDHRYGVAAVVDYVDAATGQLCLTIPYGDSLHVFVLQGEYDFAHGEIVGLLMSDNHTQAIEDDVILSINPSGLVAVGY